jgi:DNA processing protein
MASEQNREVCCIPGFPMDPRSEGTNLLIKKGASLVTSSADILELLNNYEKRAIKPISFNENDDAFYEDGGESEVNVDLLSVISTSPTSVDELVNIHGFSPSDINSKLLEHEIAGEIIRHPGNMISKVA